MHHYNKYIYIYIYIYIGAGIPDPQFNILKYLISEKGCEHRDESNFLPINIRVGDIRQGDCSHRVRLLPKAYNVRIHSPGLPYGSDEFRRRLGGHPMVRRRFKENQRYPFKCDERQTANMMCGSCNTSISFSGPSNVFHNQNQPAPMAQHPHSQMGCHQDRPGRGLLWTGEADCQHEFRYPPCVSNCLPSPRPGMVQGRRLQALVAACAEMTRPLHLGGRMNFNSKPNGSLLGYSPHGTG